MKHNEIEDFECPDFNDQYVRASVGKEGTSIILDIADHLLHGKQIPTEINLYNARALSDWLARTLDKLEGKNG